MDRLQDIAAIEAVVARMEAAWNTGDPAGFAAEFAEDADFTSIRGEFGHGRAVIQEGHRQILSTIYLSSTSRMRVESTRFLGDDAVVVLMTNHLEYEIAGQPKVTDGRQTVVMERRDGRWQIVAFQNTTVAEAIVKV